MDNRSVTTGLLYLTCIASTVTGNPSVPHVSSGNLSWRTPTAVVEHLVLDKLVELEPEDGSYH